MKVALCFIINYEHVLNKEEIWKKWIQTNKDIINVYFFYKDITKIKSQWIREHALPQNQCSYNTSYLHVIPAYISLMNYAFNHDKGNLWFSFLTDSCCPIISPRRFRYLFFNNYSKSVMKWCKAWWNPQFHKRANLMLLPEEFRLANDPWFVLKREDVQSCINYIRSNPVLVKTICNGGLANESLFAIILYSCNKLQNVLCESTHATDWSRMASSTSPYLFSHKCDRDIQFIEKMLRQNEYTMFVRKIAVEFPDDVLEYYIYEYSKEKDKKLVIQHPYIFFRILNVLSSVWFCFLCGLLIYALRFLIFYPRIRKGFSCGSRCL